MESDTIAAITTPLGEGGVGIVRVSGPLSSVLPQRLFPGLRAPWRSHRMRHGRLVDPATGERVDDAMGCLMCGPRTYTGEDVLEIHCHGNPLVLERVVSICLAEGCRPARPGEFTLRAFLNRKMDLSQAEAVLDVVRASTNAGLDLALQQLAGWLSERIEPLRSELVGTLAHMEAMVDFVEDDIPPQADSRTTSQLKTALGTVEELLRGADQGIILREGATLAIVGSPNVGKSSLMNALLGADRSIVTPVAGTTRDTVEERLQVRGIAFRTIDTAGITATEDMVEGLGIERSRRAIEAADVLLLVLDRSRRLNRGDVMAIEAAERVAGSNGRSRRLVLALNKSDLPRALEEESVSGTLRPMAVVETSALSTGGVDTLRDALEVAALGGNREEFVLGNVRHQDALRRAAQALATALERLEDGTPLDLVSFDVRAACVALGEITGASVDTELLDRIFRDFCIGK